MLFFKLSAFYFFYFSAVGVYIIFLPKVLHDIGYTPSDIGVLLALAPLMRFLTPFLFLKHIKLDQQLFKMILLLSIISSSFFYITIEHFYMFMIMMPLMYLTTYVAMDGAEAFKSNDMAHWITTAIYGIITVIFWVKKGQTPGFKAYDLLLIDDNTKRPVSYGIAIARYMMFLVSAVSIVGAILPFFRKDKKTLQDLVMQTSVIKISQ